MHATAVKQRLLVCRLLVESPARCNSLEDVAKATDWTASCHTDDTLYDNDRIYNVHTSMIDGLFFNRTCNEIHVIQFYTPSF